MGSRNCGWRISAQPSRRSP